MSTEFSTPELVVLGLEGTLSVGKSTLGKVIVNKIFPCLPASSSQPRVHSKSEKGFATSYLEVEDIPPPLRDAFYADPRGKGLLIQMVAFLSRMNQQRYWNPDLGFLKYTRGGTMEKASDQRHLVVLDRTVAGDWVFAAANREDQSISLPDFALYMRTREDQGLTSPSDAPGTTHYLYLFAPVKTLQTRIAMRATSSESGISPNYLDALNRFHVALVIESLLARTPCPLGVLVWNPLPDFSNPEACRNIRHTILELTQRPEKEEKLESWSPPIWNSASEAIKAKSSIVLCIAETTWVRKTPIGRFPYVFSTDLAWALVGVFSACGIPLDPKVLNDRLAIVKNCDMENVTEAETWALNPTSKFCPPPETEEI